MSVDITKSSPSQDLSLSQTITLESAETPGFKPLKYALFSSKHKNLIIGEGWAKKWPY